MSRPPSCSLPLVVWLAGCVVLGAEFALGDEPPRWLQWRGPDRAARAPDTGLSKDWTVQPPKLLWMTTGFGRGYASVSLDHGRVYTTGNQEGGQAVVAASAADGKTLWTKLVTSSKPKHSYEGSRSTPTIDGDRLYVVASSGKIVCLAAETGDIAWQRDFQEWGGRMMSGWGYSESPLVDGDWVLCTPGGAKATIVALHKLTGEQVWAANIDPFLSSKGARGPKDGAAYSSIVVSNAAGVKQYVQFVGRGVIGVRASDGAFLWGYGRVANGTANIPTPIISGDQVFCSSGYGTGSALLTLSAGEDGQVTVKEEYFLPASTLQNHHGGLIQVGDHVYGGQGHGNGFPICVALADGQVQWGGDIRGEGKGSAAVLHVDGHFIFRYQSGEVAWIEASPREYRLKGVLKPAYQEDKSWAHPVVAGGKLYLREQDKLMCYDLRAKL